MKRARAKNAVAAAATALQVAAAAVAVIVAVVTAAAVAAGANLAGSYLDFFDMGPRRIRDAALFLFRSDLPVEARYRRRRVQNVFHRGGSSDRARKSATMELWIRLGILHFIEKIL